MFVKFRSLTNAYQQKFINLCQMQGVSQWLVTEKIHGCNMGLYYNKDGFGIAKRSSMTDGQFYNCGPNVSKYEEDIKKLYDTITDVEQLIVYGEYFGGSYDGKSEDQAKKVQKGVDYIPGNDFLAFMALAIVNGKEYWLSTAELALYFSELGTNLRTVPILASGLTLTDALQVSNEQDSVVPQMYGLDPIEGNISEGTVITPMYGVDFVIDNDIFLGIKNKNDKWSEKSKASKTPKLPLEVSEELEAATAELLRYATENRFANVLSKEGEFDKKQIGKYLGLLMQDCWQDYLSDNNIESLDTKERKFMSTQLVNACRPIVLSHM